MNGWRFFCRKCSRRWTADTDSNRRCPSCHSLRTVVDRVTS